MNGSNNGNSLNFARVDAICGSSPLLTGQNFSLDNTYDTETFAHVLASMFPNLAPTLFGDSPAAPSHLSKMSNDKELSKYCSLFDGGDECDGEDGRTNTSSSPSSHLFAVPFLQASPLGSSYERYSEIASPIPRSSTASDEQPAWLEDECGPRSTASSIRSPPSPVYVEDLFELSEPVYAFVDSTEPLDYGDSPVPSLAHPPTESCDSLSEGPVTPTDGPNESHTALDGDNTSLPKPRDVNDSHTDADVEKLPSSDVARHDPALDSGVYVSTCPSPSVPYDPFCADDLGIPDVVPDDDKSCEVLRKDGTTDRVSDCSSPAPSDDIPVVEGFELLKRTMALGSMSDEDKYRADKFVGMDAAQVPHGTPSVAGPSCLSDCRETFSQGIQQETRNSDCQDHGVLNDDKVNLAPSEYVLSTLPENRGICDDNASVKFEQAELAFLAPTEPKRGKKRKRTMGEYAQSFVPSPSRPAFFFPVRATQRTTKQLEVTHVPLNMDDIIMLSSMRGDDGRCKFPVLKDGIRTRCNQELVKDNSLLYAHFAIHYHQLEYYRQGPDFKPVCPWCNKRPARFGGLNRHIVYTELKVNSDLCDCGGRNSRSNQKNNSSRHENSAMHRAYVRRIAEEARARGEVGSNDRNKEFPPNPEGREFVEGSSRETKRMRTKERSESALLL